MVSLTLILSSCTFSFNPYRWEPSIWSNGLDSYRDPNVQSSYRNRFVQLHSVVSQNARFSMFAHQIKKTKKKKESQAWSPCPPSLRRWWTKSFPFFILFCVFFLKFLWRAFQDINVNACRRCSVKIVHPTSTIVSIFNLILFDRVELLKLNNYWTLNKRPDWFFFFLYHFFS